MNQQLFDLDRALDDFEHEELDKLAGSSSQTLFQAKPLQFLRRSVSPHGEQTNGAANLHDKAAIPSILCLLNTSSSAVGETADHSVHVASNHSSLLHPEILDEDTKDMLCGGDVSSSHSHSSSDRAGHLVLEEQSSSNMDSGLCSSSEFASLDAGDYSAPTTVSNSGNNVTLQNMFVADNSEHAFETPTELTNRSYSDEVALLFSGSVTPAVKTPLVSTGSSSVADSESTIRTPTLASPGGQDSNIGVKNGSVLTPVGTNSLRRHSDAAGGADSQAAPARPSILNLSFTSTSASCDTKNDSFFFPESLSHAGKQPFHSLPVVSSNSSSSSSASNAPSGGCRRPSSLLLTDSAMDGAKHSTTHQAVGTKRPSSLFGLPCVVPGSGAGNELNDSNNLSPQQDRKKMLLPPAEDLAKPTLSVTASEPISMVTSSNSANTPMTQLIDQTAGISVTPITPVVGSVGALSGRRSPSNCSANSEIIQLPVPAVPSSTSSYSPDSASLSRSSLCDGMPSPLAQPASFGGAVGGIGLEAQSMVDTTLVPESPMESRSDNNSRRQDAMEDDDLATLAALEAAAAAESRVLPCGDTLGRQAPPWVPDSDAPACSGCAVRFTFTKRRHHCRACGKVYCNQCCSLRYHLEFLNAVARVCILCYPELVRLEARRNNNTADGPPTAAPSALRNVMKSRNGQSAHSSTSSSGKSASGESRRNKKKVVFSDGVRPGEHPGVAPANDPNATTTSSEAASSADTSPMEPNNNMIAVAGAAGATTVISPVKAVAASALPSCDKPVPILIKAHFSWSSDKSKFIHQGLAGVCDDVTHSSIVLTLNTRLALRIQRVDLSSCCCPSLTASSPIQLPYYAVVSMGLCAAADTEYMVILRTNSLSGYIDGVVKFFERLWADAEQGRFYEDFAFLSIDALGFLVFRPSFQCTQHLPLPVHARWMAAVVIVDPNELAWARLFPLRLMLRLGHEFGHYPAPIVSDVARSPLFHQPGHTVLSLFSDFRSFRYRLEAVEGAVLHLDRATNTGQIVATSDAPVSRRHVLLIPVTAANQVRQLAVTGHEHVLAIGTSFSPSADGHLVAVQAIPPDASYRTEAITMLGVSSTDQIRIVAGSFIIFNGSLRPDPSGSSRARLTVLEDGAMLQISCDQMTELRSALASKQNFTVSCTTANSSEGDATTNDSLQIEWIQSTPEISSQWTRPQSALRCRLPIGFNSTMIASLSQQIANQASCLRVAATYAWPFDPVAQAAWCSPSVYTNAALSNESSSSSSTNSASDSTQAQSAVIAYVLDRASLAFASATQLALTPFADAFVRTAAISSTEVSICELPVQVIVRIRLDPDNLGFEATMKQDGVTEFLSLPDTAVEALDSELIPTLFNVAQALGSKLPTGGLCFELTLFAMPPVVLSPSEESVKTIPNVSEEPFAAEMLVDDNS